MKMTRLLTLILTPCLFVLITNLPAIAQSASATLSGTVVDANGAVVPGAAITLTDTTRGFERNVATKNDGSFTIPLLQPSTYILLVAREGFASAQVENVVLNINDSRTLRVELKISPVKGEVIVTPDASMADQSPAVSTTIDRTFVGNLPLSGRSLQSLIFLTPGVVATPAQSQNPGEFSVNGQRSNANYFTVDGVSANTAVSSNAASSAAATNAMAGQLPGLGASGSTSALVSVDALEEFKIQTSTYSAQYGRQPGGQVQLVTRSGNNNFRGTLFEYIRNEVFDARNYFNMEPTPKPPTRLNQFGGTFSGPIYLPNFGDGGPRLYRGKDRTFFFFSYEGQRLRLPSNEIQSVPSLRIRQLAPAVFRPILNSFPLPTGDEIVLGCNPTSTGCSPDGTRLSGSSRYVASFSNPRSQDATSIRIDHKVTGEHSLFGRYNYAPSNSLSRTLARLNGRVFDSHLLTFGVASAFSSRVSNEFRFNFTRNRATGAGYMDDFGGAVPIGVSDLLPGYAGELKSVSGNFIYNTLFAGSSEMQIGQTVNHQQRQFNIVDNLTWTFGTHALSIGFDYRRLAPIYGPLQYRQSGTAFITDGASEQSFLAGNISSVVIDGQSTAVMPRFDNFSAYIQDSWKISRRLTLELGLRWEFNPTPSEASGRNPVFVAGVEDLATARLLEPDERWYKTHYTAFAPRFGAAYLLNQKAGMETMFRGGFGIFYDLNSGMTTAAYGGFPFSVRKDLCCNIAYPITTSQAALPPIPAVQLPISAALYALNEGLQLPYTSQWNFSLEQSLGKFQTLTVGYVAAAGRRLTARQRLNQRIGNPNTGPRPNSNFGDINYVTNGPTSDYHSMQLHYQRRLSQGLQALVNYTWSHAIDEVSNEVEQGTLLRGNASFDIRHNITTAITYNVPRWKRYSLLDTLLRDWSFDAVALAYSGRPLDIFVTSGSQVDIDGNFLVVRPDVVSGVPFWIEDGNAPGGRRINRAAFVRPPLVPGTTNRYEREGTLGRNVVREPELLQVNLAIRRQFGFSEQVKLEVRGEAFNLFNTPLFAGYNTSYSPTNLNFGLATTTLNNRSSGGGGLNSLYALGGPRSMQFSVRLSF